MIAKCLVVLAVVAQIYGSPCGCGQETSVVLPTTSSSCSSGSSDSSSSSGATTINRNLVGKGKYPVALKNCGPTPDQQIPVTTSRVTAPVQEKPTVRLPARIPAPRTICHTCTCYKTIVRPRVHQQIITVPTVQRYIETTHKPVIESIQYEAVPVNCDNSDSSSSGSLQFVEVGSSGSSSQSSSCGSTQTIEIPAPQTCEAPRVQVVEAPRVQTCEAPRVQTIEIPRIEAPRVQVVEAPRVQTCEAPRVQTIEIPRIEAPRVQVVEAPRVQTVEIPQSFSCNSCQF